MLTEWELEKVLEIAPFLDRDILTEEDIKTIMSFLQTHLEYQSSFSPQQEYFPFSQNLAIFSSSHRGGGNLPENLTFKLSNFLAQQNKVEATPILQESTSKTDSRGEVKIKPSTVHFFENPLFSAPKPEKLAQKFQYSAIPKQVKTRETQISIIQTYASTIFPLFIPQQVMAHPASTRMQQTVTARYAPLALPQPLHPLPEGAYLKYLPKYIGEGEGVSTEEHLVSFYSYADNQNIKHKDVSSRLFVQSLDGEARKWFGNLPPNSITRI